MVTRDKDPNDWPKVTIGIVCRNEEDYIQETLKSLLNLDYPSPKYEIIVVDGDSEDKTYQKAKKTLQKPNINHKVVKESEYENNGLCFARNLVVRLSSDDSNYIAYTDADCLLEQEWLTKLVSKIKGSSKKVAGVGGPRYVAKTDNKKELVINHFITSFIATAGNPAFVKRNIEFVDSIPNYNGIYKKHILQENPYDEDLLFSDDNEVNHRIREKGYKFLYEPDAKVYHHETDSIKEFADNMYGYGINIANTMIKHGKFVRSYIPIVLGFLLYIVFLPIIYYVIGWISLIPLLFYFIFVLSVFIEVLLKTKTIYSALIFILTPIQHLSYGLGIINNLKSNLIKKIT